MFLEFVLTVHIPIPEEAGHMVHSYIIEEVLDLENKALPASLC